MSVTRYAAATTAASVAPAGLALLDARGGEHRQRSDSLNVPIASDLCCASVRSCDGQHHCPRHGSVGPQAPVHNLAIDNRGANIETKQLVVGAGIPQHLFEASRFGAAVRVAGVDEVVASLAAPHLRFARIRQAVRQRVRPAQPDLLAGHVPRHDLKVRHECGEHVLGCSALRHDLDVDPRRAELGHHDGARRSLGEVDLNPICVAPAAHRPQETDSVELMDARRCHADSIGHSLGSA